MKYLYVILTSLILISCSETVSQFKNGIEISDKVWENKKPEILSGLYGTNRQDSEQGTIIFMSDKVVIQTTNHEHEFIYTEYMNSIGYCDGILSSWSLRVNDIEYRFTLVTTTCIEFSFKRDSDKDFNKVGVYYQNFEQPINEM